MNTDVASPPAVRGPEAGTVVLTINGQVRELQIEARVSLLDALREHLALAGVKDLPGGGLRIGALARMSDVARAPGVVARFPVSSQALLAGRRRRCGTWPRSAATCASGCGAATSATRPRRAISEPGSGCAAERAGVGCRRGIRGPSRSENTFSNHDSPIARRPGTGTSASTERTHHEPTVQVTSLLTR